MAVAKAAIVILTQGSEVRRAYLKTTLYFLFRHFNAKFSYPVRILVQSDYQENWRDEIRQSVRLNFRHLISFVTIDDADFLTPKFIDRDRLDANLKAAPVPYWRNECYRNMCRFWLVHLPKYVADLDTMMRLDDDALIEEPIQIDLFSVMRERGISYVSNLVHIDCPVCCYEMRDFFVNAASGDYGRIANVTKMFHRASIKPELLKSILSCNGSNGAPSGECYMPIMYYNNFHITDLHFWRRKDVIDLVDKIDRTGNIFYYRWGDAPLQTLILHSLLSDNKIGTVKFRYSKRLQREAFDDHDGKLHSYMPHDYDNTTCISYQQQQEKPSLNKDVPDIITL